MQERISILNTKLETDIVYAKKDCFTKDDKVKRDLTHEMHKITSDKITKELAMFTKKTDDKLRAVRKDLVNMIDKRVTDVCDDRLNIPGYVGPDQPYNTLTNFLISFSTKAEIDIEELKVKQTAFQSRQDNIQNVEDKLVLEMEMI